MNLSKVQFLVTQEDIDQGERKSSHNCPVNLALRRALEGQYTRINVYSSDIVVHRGRIPIVYPVWGELRDYIRDIDSGLEVSPQKFEIETQGGWNII